MIRYAAPGRINLIGEHTDYNLGFALPIAIPQRTIATFAPSPDDAVTVTSDRADGTVRIPIDTAPGGVTGWASYVAGVIWALGRAGHRVVGGELSITSNLETGTGLGSSAALECACLGALSSGTEIDRHELARLAHAAENEYAGAPTGLLDQLASLYGQPRTALLIDFHDLSVQPVPFDPDTRGVALMVIDSGARHSHADGQYAKRRASCERAAAKLGVATLRDVHRLDGVSDPVDAHRARHVLTENQRVLDVAAALRVSDYAAVGAAMTASHASMRDDFEITTEHIDVIAEAAVAAGALGARMTGGGFGGSVIALVDAERPAQVEDAVRQAVCDAGYPAPTISRTHAGPGATRL